MGLNKTKSNEKSKSKQIKTGKIGKLEAKRKKIIEIKERKKNERLSEKMQKKVEEAKAETKVDQEGFFVLPTEFELDQNDEDILAQFGSIDMSTGKKVKGTSVQDMIKELDNEIDQRTDEKVKQDPRKNEKIKAVYEDVAKFLKIYRSQKMIKPLKVLPMVENCFQILEITNPKQWSPHAMYALVNMYVNTMSVDQLRIFLNRYLLPAVIQNITQHKKLDYQYYASLRRAFYKPAAWFRGILYPLVKIENLTLKVITIVASVIASKSIPVVHSSISLIKLSTMKYSAAQNIFIMTLLDKKYNLPRSSLHAIFDWIMNFQTLEIKLPVIWFKTVLIFCQHYGQHLTEENKSDLKSLVKFRHKHHLISKEIIRKLFNRGQSLNVTMMDDSLMVNDD